MQRGFILTVSPEQKSLPAKKIHVTQTAKELISSGRVIGKKTSHAVRGFTLIEILIVVSITIMISTLAISFTSSTQQQIGLYVEVQKLAELILRAKSLSVTTYNDPQAAADPTVVTCGYGVSIDYTRNGYELFSYRVPVGQSCESIQRIENVAPNPPNEITTLSSHDVAPGVVILNNGNPDSIYKVFFIPPLPVTLIGTASDGITVGKNNPGKIYLTTKDATLSAAISVSAIGQVDF